MKRNPMRAALVRRRRTAYGSPDAGALLLVYSSDAEMLHSGFTQAMATIRGKRSG